MAGYHTDDELKKDVGEDLLRQLTDDDNAGVVNWETVDEKRKDVDALIDAACMNLYGDQLPFNPVPRVIKKLSKEFTLYELYNRRLGAPENLQIQNKNNLKLLEGIGKGDIKLGAIAGETAPEPSADPGITVATAKQMFPHKKWDQF